MYEIIVLFFTGFAAGSISGVLGIGGGILVIPMLVGLLGYSQKEAQGTSLGLLLPPVGLFAVINYYRAGYVDMKAVILMAFAFAIGGYISSLYALNLPESTLRKTFAFFLIFYAYKLLFNK